MTSRLRLLVLLALAAAGAGLAFAGALPEGYATVGAVVAGEAHGHGKAVTVKAAVVDGTVERDADPVRFTVTDGASTLTVVWPRALPEHEAGGVLDGRTVVVTGTVEERDGERVLVGESMQVGCASKYERA